MHFGAKSAGQEFLDMSFNGTAGATSNFFNLETIWLEKMLFERML
jgi:hypothetical protein